MFDRLKFQRLRQKAGLTQVSFGKYMGKSRRAIQTWEQGTSSPSISDIRIICQILNINTKEISDVDNIEMPTPTNLQKTSFVARIKSSISIEDRILLQGVNSELQELRSKLQNLEKQNNNVNDFAVDELNLIIYKKNNIGQFIYINNAFLRHFSLPSTQVIGKTNAEVFTTKESKILTDSEADAYKGLFIKNAQIVIPRTLSERHGLLSANPICEKNGTIKEIIFIINDITDTLKVCRNYHALEEAVNSSNEVLWINNSNGNRLFIGAPVYTISGYHVNEFLNNKNFWLTQVVDDTDKERVKQFYQLFDNEEAIIYKIKTKDNRTKTIKEKLFKKDGLTFGILQDISSELETQKDKQLLLDIIDKLPEAILLVGDHGKKVLRASKTMKDITGIPEKTLYTTKCNEELLKLVYKDDKERVFKHRDYIDSEEWWQDKSKKSMSLTIKYRISKNGQIKWLQASNYSTTQLKAKGIRFSTLKDITNEQKQQLEMQYLFECVNDMDSLFWIAQCINKRNDKYKYVTVSRGVKNIYGITKSQFIANNINIKNLFFPYSRNSTLELPEDIVYPYTAEYEIQFSGMTKWLQTRIYKKDNLLFGMVVDITDKHFRETEKEYLSNALDNIDSLFWVLGSSLDEDSNSYTYRTFTEGVNKIFGCSKETFLENRTYWENSIHPSHKKIIDLNLYEIPNEKFPLNIEYKVIIKGKEKWIKERVYKKDNLVFGLCTDITKYKQKSDRLIIEYNA